LTSSNKVTSPTLSAAQTDDSNDSDDNEEQQEEEIKSAFGEGAKVKVPGVKQTEGIY
jgi:hypothetical protein